MKKLDPALVVVLAGVSAALHVGKLPPALPVLREALGVTLLQAGFLLSMVQLAGMTLGLVAGLAADGIGLKRTMLAGLVLLSGTSAAGGLVDNVHGLLALRALEGVGFLLVSMPAPGLIRQLVAPSRMSAMLGVWGAYMPFGTACALLLGPATIATVGWQGWWWLLAAVSALAALWVALVVPSIAPAAVPSARPAGWGLRLKRTLTAPGPWLVAFAFAMYSGQWLSVIGFLPSVYAQAGWAAGWAGIATAAAAAVNIAGNIASGHLLQRGVAPQRLLYAGFCVMFVGAVVAFAPVWPASGGDALPHFRYVAVLAFSMVGGMIPGTLFSLAVRVAPDEGTVSTTVGWMQQWSSIGQFAGPPLVAWVATMNGSWDFTWVVTGACSVTGVAIAIVLGAALRSLEKYH